MAVLKLKFLSKAILIATTTVILSACGGGSNASNSGSTNNNHYQTPSVRLSDKAEAKAPLSIKNQVALYYIDNQNPKENSSYYSSITVRSLDSSKYDQFSSEKGKENFKSSYRATQRDANNRDSSVDILEILNRAEQSAPVWDEIMSENLLASPFYRDSQNIYWNHYQSYKNIVGKSILNAPNAKVREADNVLTSTDYWSHASEVHNLANDEYSRVLVIEPHYTKFLERDNSRVSVEIIPLSENMGIAGNDYRNPVAHGDQVVQALLMNNNHQIRNDYNIGSYTWLHYDGFLAKHGLVKVLAHHGEGINKRFTNNNTFRIEDLILEEPIAKAAKEGYKIVNLSVGAHFTKEDIVKKYNAKAHHDRWENLLVRNHNDFYQAAISSGIGNNPNYSVINNILKLGREHDVLFIEANGNDPEIINANPLIIESSTDSNGKKVLTDIKDFYITVTAKPHAGSKSTFTPCAVSRDYCVTAPQYYIALYNRDYKKYVGSTTSSATAGEGTSFAAPYVAGLAATVKAIYPFFTNHNLQQTILTTASKMDSNGNIIKDNNYYREKPDFTWGWGMVNPVKAVNGPAAFRNKDFVVDLNHDILNKDLSKKVYYFNNDIRGDKGLVVTNSNPEKASPLLNLTGANSYTGNTVVKAGGRLNIDGALSSSIVTVEADGQLSGRGSILALHAKKGAVISSSSLVNIDLRNNPAEAVARLANYKHSLFIASNFFLEEGSHLFVEPNQPIVTGGQAIIDKAILHVNPKISHFNKEGFAVQEVVYAQKGIKGDFAEINTPNSLTIAEAYTSRLFQGTDRNNSSKHDDDKAASLVAVISLSSASEALERKAEAPETATERKVNDSYFKNGTKVLDAINSTLKTEPSSLNLASSESGATSTLRSAGVRSLSVSNSSLAHTANFLSAAEYEDANYISNLKFRQFTTAAISNTVRNSYYDKPYSVTFSGDPHQFKFNSSLAFALNDYNQVTGQVEYHRGSFDTPLTKNASKFSSLSLGIGTKQELGAETGIGANFNYNLFSTDLDRKGYFLNKAVNNTASFKTNSLSLDFYTYFNNVFIGINGNYSITSSDTEHFGDLKFKYENKSNFGLNLKLGFEYKLPLSFIKDPDTHFKAKFYTDISLYRDYEASVTLTDKNGESVKTILANNARTPKVTYYQDLSFGTTLSSNLRGEVFGYCASDFKSKFKCGAGITLVFGNTKH